MLMVDSQGDNIRVSRGGEWCYNISTPEYPRVAGAQLINHFVSGGVRYHIHIREQKGIEGGGERDRESRWITPMRIVFRDSHSRIVDGSTGIIVTSNGPATTHNDDFRPDDLGVPLGWGGPRASSSRNGGENYKCLIFWLVWPGLFSCFSTVIESVNEDEVLSFFFFFFFPNQQSSIFDWNVWFF